MESKRFVSESVAELKKVEWPTRDQLVRGATTVLVVCLIVGFFLYGSDIASKHISHFIFH